MCWLNFTCGKLRSYAFPQNHLFKSFCTCALCGTYPYPVSESDFTEFFKNRHNLIKLCCNKSKKMPRLNNDERNQAIGMLNAGMSATVVSRHFGCTRKTIERLQRRFPATGNVADRPRSSRPRVTNAADNPYIVLQHLRNRHLTAATTGRRYGIHPEIRWDKTFNLLVRTNRTSVKFSPKVIERQGGIGAAVTCTSDVLIGIWFCFPMNVGLTLAMPTDVREFIAVVESVLPMCASLSGTVSEVVQS